MREINLGGRRPGDPYVVAFDPFVSFFLIFDLFFSGTDYIKVNNESKTRHKVTQIKCFLKLIHALSFFNKNCARFTQDQSKHGCDNLNNCFNP